MTVNLQTVTLLLYDGCF